MRIRCTEDITMLGHHYDTAVTLFSGGLDSSYLLYLLSTSGFKRIIALTVDLGDDIDHDQISKVASHFGALSIIVDRKEAFVKTAVLPAIAAQAKYLGIYPISASLSRPLLAQEAVTVARENNCQIILHTANQSQNSLRRLNGAITQLNFEGYFGTPYEFSAISREEKAEALAHAGLDLFKSRNHSGDSNLWCREFESGLLDDPENFAAEDEMYKWSRPPRHEDESAIQVTFFKGRPTAINSIPMSPVELIAQLNTEVGRFGLGRYCGLEHLDAGEKVLEVREMPAAFLLMDAYRHLETATLDIGTLREKMTMEQTWAIEAVEGRWFSPQREAAQAYIDTTSEHVSGTVSYRLDCTGATPHSIVAQNPLYLRDRDGWEKKIAADRNSRTLPSIVAIPCNDSTQPDKAFSLQTVEVA